MSLAPLDIPKPTLQERAEFGADLSPLRFRNERMLAAETARNDPRAAIRRLEILERLQFWDFARGDEGTKELEASMVQHADLLAAAGLGDEAARVLLAARQVASLRNHPRSLRRLADQMAAEEDDSRLAMGIYADHLKWSTSGRNAPSAAVLDHALRVCGIGGGSGSGETMHQDALALEGIAGVCARLKRWTDAAALYELLARRRSSGHRGYLAQAGRARFLAGQYDEAIKLLGSTDSQDDGEAQHWLARSLLRLGQAAKASEIFGRLCESRQCAADFLYGASSLAREGRHSQGISLLRRGVALFPDDEALKLQEARILVASGAPVEAIALLAGIRDVDDQAELAELAAAAHYAAGDFESARKRMRQVAGPEPDRPKDLHALALIALRSRDYEEAARCARECVRVAPEFTPGQVVLTLLLAREGSLDEARNCLDKPSDDAASVQSAFLWMHGLLAIKTGDYENAVRSWVTLDQRGENSGLTAAVLNILRPLGFGPRTPAPTKGLTADILKGRRDKAHEFWLRRLSENAGDYRSAHSLALLHYFWAREHVANRLWARAADSWRMVSESWGVALNAPAFIESIAQAKTGTFGREVTVEEVASACDRVQASALKQMRAEAASGGDAESEAIFRSGYMDALAEIRAAQIWARAAKRLAGKLPAAIPIAGPRGLARFGGLETVQIAIAGSARKGLDKPTANKLRMAYSGLAPEWALVDAKEMDWAIEELTKVRFRSTDQRELLAEAYFEKGLPLLDDEARLRSMEVWAKSVAELDGIHSAKVRFGIEPHAVEACRWVLNRMETVPLDLVRQFIPLMLVIGRSIQTPVLEGIFVETLTEAALKEMRDPAGDLERAERLLLDVREIAPQHEPARKALAELPMTRGRR